MLLRTRVTLIVTFTYSLLVAGLFFAGLKNEELADERYVQATLNGQQIFWDKLVENTVQRLEAAAPLLVANQEMIAAIARKSPSEARELMAPTVAGLTRRGVGRVEIVGLDGDDRIVHFVEKPSEPPSTLAATVIYLLPQAHARLVAEYLAAGHSPDNAGSFVAWLARRAPVYGYAFEGRWYDIGNHGQLLEADNEQRALVGLPQRNAYALE